MKPEFQQAILAYLKIKIIRTVSFISSKRQITLKFRFYGRKRRFYRASLGLWVDMLISEKLTCLWWVQNEDIEVICPFSGFCPLFYYPQ